MSDSMDPNHPAFNATNLEDMIPTVVDNALVLRSPPSIPTLTFDYSCKKKYLNFIKEPHLANPILQIVESKGFKKTLGHRKKADFLKWVKKNLCRSWQYALWV